ncbi:AcrR family transcriptional regulator [Bradyrhizobium sp. USDA 4516]
MKVDRVMTPSVAIEAKPKRFRRREAVLGVAIQLINEVGLRGMTFVEVANKLGIVATGIAYYFRRKEQLASACYISSLQRIQGFIASTSGETVEARLRAFLSIYCRYLADATAGRALAIVRFDEVRVLADSAVDDAIAQTFSKFRQLLRNPADRNSRVSNAHAHLLFSWIFWMPALLERHSEDEYEAIAGIVLRLWLEGVSAQPLTGGRPRALAHQSPRRDDRAEDFLKAATKVLNEQGYAGASVERISAMLNVTKGSFYHHHEAKDDLVVSCFERSLSLVQSAKQDAARLSAPGAEKLRALAVHLIEHQLLGEAPLLSMSALMTLPKHIRADLLHKSDRITNGFALLFSEGMEDGSIRTTSPVVAAWMLSSMINAAVDLRTWVPDLTVDNVADLFVRPFFEGYVRSSV